MLRRDSIEIAEIAIRFSSTNNAFARHGGCGDESRRALGATSNTAPWQRRRRRLRLRRDVDRVGVRGGPRAARRSTSPGCRRGRVTELRTSARHPGRRRAPRLIMAGGGPRIGLERDPHVVRPDVREGLVTRKRAHDVYGVVLDGALEIDAAATMAAASTSETAEVATFGTTSARTTRASIEASVRIRPRSRSSWVKPACRSSTAPHHLVCRLEGSDRRGLGDTDAPPMPWSASSARPIPIMSRNSRRSDLGRTLCIVLDAGDLRRDLRRGRRPWASNVAELEHAAQRARGPPARDPDRAVASDEVGPKTMSARETRGPRPRSILGPGARIARSTRRRCRRARRTGFATCELRLQPAEAAAV